MTLSINGKRSLSNGKTNKMVLLSILSFLTFIGFFDFPYLDFVVSILLLICFLYLYFIEREKIIVCAFLLFANDALGQVFNLVSLKYLVVVFLLFEIINMRFVKIQKMHIFSFLLSLLLILQPYVTGLDDLKGMFNTIAPFLLVFILFIKNNSKRDFFSYFALGSSLIIFLLALHACVTGGYNGQGHSSYGVVRAGILGIGVGDSNFSALILCIGIVFALNCSKLNRFIKAIFVLTMVAAISVTLSTAGFFCLVVIFVLTLVLNRKKYHIVSIGFFLISAILIMYYVYRSLPQSVLDTKVGAYANRIVDKINALFTGDYGSFSTGRSDLAEFYWNFIINQDLDRILFGGNYLLQGTYFPHNTYIDFLVQFGFVGLAIISLYAIVLIAKTFKDKKHDEYRRGVLTLKIVLAIFISSLSVYHGPAFVATLFVMLVL